MHSWSVKRVDRLHLFSVFDGNIVERSTLIDWNFLRAQDIFAQENCSWVSSPQIFMEFQFVSSLALAATGLSA